MTRPNPDITVVVPVYRDWDKVPQLLTALAQQTCGLDAFEVVIVANDTGPAAPITARTLNLRWLTCETPGSYAARNIGWRGAQAAWVAFTDADCLPDPQWLDALLQATRIHPEKLIAGDIKVVGAAQPSLFSDYDRVIGLPQATYVARGDAATANLSVARETLEALGGFDAARFSGGDAEFCRKAARAGFGLHFARDAVVEHPARTTFRAHYQKLRRVRGGQIAAGSLTRRLKYLLRTSLPPLRRTVALLRADASLKARSNALCALYLLWFAGFGETLRLLLGGKPVR